MPSQAARGLALAVLAAGLTGAHLWLAEGVLVRTMALREPERVAPIEVSFVRELQPAAPLPAAPALPRPLRAAAVAPPPAAPASSPGPVPPDTSSAPAVAAMAPAGQPPPAAAEDAAPKVPADPGTPTAVAAPAAAASAAGPSGPAVAEGPALASSAPAFEWPPSTRLSYTLTGYYRGPVEGQARVEWRRSDSRYQVEVTVEVGPFFAPLMSRTARSDGEITAAGLRPRRYAEETRVAFAQPRRLEFRFEDDAVVLPSGRRVPRPEGLQDSASQFVQLTWLFTLQPHLLSPGQAVTLPLALPHRVEPWLYEVVAQEALHTPFGVVDAVHVRPRRAPRPGLEMTAEMWFAPTLQYLPVRILIRHDAQSWIDLLVERLPQQAAPR